MWQALFVARMSPMSSPAIMGMAAMGGMTPRMVNRMVAAIMYAIGIEIGG